MYFLPDFSIVDFSRFSCECKDILMGGEASELREGAQGTCKLVVRGGKSGFNLFFLSLKDLPKLNF